MIGMVMTATRFGLAAASGTDAFVDAAAQFAVKLALQSKATNTEAAEDMVAEMRSRVPQDTGRLFGGITFEADDNGSVQVIASAKTAAGTGFDYAFLVEHGTAHMDAQPYFYGPAEEELAQRGQDLDAAIARAAAEEGF
jgi:HK97 gp10 family phage protein